MGGNTPVYMLGCTGGGPAWSISRAEVEVVCLFLVLFVSCLISGVGNLAATGFDGLLRILGVNETRGERERGAALLKVNVYYCWSCPRFLRRSTGSLADRPSLQTDQMKVLV